jgi:hypothetical protein
VKDAFLAYSTEYHDILLQKVRELQKKSLSKASLRADFQQDTLRLITSEFKSFIRHVNCIVREGDVEM